MDNRLIFLYHLSSELWDVYKRQGIASFLNGSLPAPNNIIPERNSYWDKFDMHNRIVRQKEQLRTKYSLQDIIDVEIDLAKLNILKNIKYAPFTSTGSSILNSLILSYEEYPSLVIKTFQQYLRDCNAWTNLLDVYKRQLLYHTFLFWTLFLLQVNAFYSVYYPLE